VSVVKSNKKIKTYQQLQDKHRYTWKKMQEKHPCLSKSSLRKIAPAAYIWLYRNDRDWLYNNSPDLKKSYKNERVNWDERDLQVLDKVKKAVGEILNYEGKPVRITVSRVGRKLGLLALLEKHIKKMPMTCNFLIKTIESVEDFQVRRVKWATKKLRKDGEEVKEWKIKRLAGLRSFCTSRVSKVINEEIMKEHYLVREIEKISIKDFHYVKN